LIAVALGAGRMIGVAATIIVRVVGRRPAKREYLGAASARKSWRALALNRVQLAALLHAASPDSEVEIRIENLAGH
jgi:hypothetical protein